MQEASTRRIDSLLTLPRSAKKALAILADSSLCVLTVWLAICLRFESWVELSDYQWLAVVTSVILAISLLTAFGFYHTVIRFVGMQTISAALKAISIYALIYSAIFTVYGFPMVPRTIGLLQPFLLLIGLGLLRILASQLLTESHSSKQLSRNLLPAVLIYGAGNSGRQLAASLASSAQSKVIGFVDDNISLHQARIADIPVYSPQKLHALCEQYGIKAILLAMPSLSRSRRNEIIKTLGSCRVAVRTLPSLTDLAQGKISESDLREVSIEDLLGRDAVAPINALITKNITSKVVLVTGAGGSIGSELCRQIIQSQPTRLILLELSEYALYAIHEGIQEICVRLAIQCDIEAILANTLDEKQINGVIEQFKPQTIYHAAAYKHVPLVESNPSAGLRNNVLGTHKLAQAALRHQVDDFVLISTDKAVRPTNVMGASKRMAEMVIQHLANEHRHAENSTRFTIVRFGNVLGSSGSVVPKFREQIQKGGPVTLTHPEVTRYFMTIPEAAQLVIQAGALQENTQEGARIYLLDMGESVKLADLARSLIQLSGHTVRDQEQPEGDIAIDIIGLRPGEKLFEELLISGKSSTTLHPKILSSEESLPSGEINALANLLSFCLEKEEAQDITRGLREFDLGYQTTDLSASSKASAYH